MEYNEFKEVLKALVQVELGDEMEVYFSTVEKNNGQMKEGITFCEKGKNCMPIIHLKELYEVYLKDDDIRICVDYVLEISKAREQVEIQMLVGTWENYLGRFLMKKRRKINVQVCNM